MEMVIGLAKFILTLPNVAFQYLSEL